MKSNMRLGLIMTKRRKIENMKKTIGILITLLCLTVTLCACTGGGSQSRDIAKEEIASVKGGNLPNWSEDVTMGKVMEDFLTDPKWDFHIDNEGWYVDCTGGCSYDDKDVTVKCRFHIVNDDSFEVYQFYIDDVLQTDDVMYSFFDKIYEDYVSGNDYDDDDVSAMLNSDYVIKDKFGGAESYLNVYRLDWDTLNEKMISGLDQVEVRQLLNALYARQGYTFTTEENRRFFGRTQWYKPDNTPMETCEKFFTETERANKDFLVAYEKKMGWR